MYAELLELQGNYFMTTDLTPTSKGLVNNVNMARAVKGKHMMGSGRTH